MTQIAIDNNLRPREQLSKPQRVDVVAAFKNKPKELDFIWPGFLAGSVGALVAPGATGKSFWALQAAMAVASGTADGDLLELSPNRKGRVLYRASEDPILALEERLYSFSVHLPETVQATIGQNLALDSLMGHPFNIMADRDFKELAIAAEGCRLVILDTLSRIHQLDENSNGDMSRLIVRLEQLASMTGAGVLFLHHVGKGSVREGQLSLQQAARGASALIDNARWCGYVVSMSEDEARKLSDQPFKKTPVGNERRENFVRYGISKQNYSAEHKDRWYQRREGGVLMPCSLREIPTNKPKGRPRHEI